MNYQNLPSWEELPNLELYLDQVLLYVNQTTAMTPELVQKELTASMVNNYVKHGYLKKPIKKKYQKEQIGRLIAISLLKNTFPIQTVVAVLEKLTAEYSPEELYNAFINYWNDNQTDDCSEVIILACQTVKHYYKTLSIVNKIQIEEEK